MKIYEIKLRVKQGRISSQKLRKRTTACSQNGLKSSSMQKQKREGKAIGIRDWRRVVLDWVILPRISSICHILGRWKSSPVSKSTRAEVQILLDIQTSSSSPVAFSCPLNLPPTTSVPYSLFCPHRIKPLYDYFYIFQDGLSCLLIFSVS